MKKKKKKVSRLKKVTSCILIIATLSVVCVATVAGSNKNEPKKSVVTIIEKAETLNDTLENTHGDCLLTFTDNIDLNVFESTTILGSLNTKNVTIDGQGKGSITALGAKKSPIAPVAGCKISFKNLTIYDNTQEVPGISTYNDYLWLGGEISFENCTFTDSIYLKETINATFINCKFQSIENNYYSVWIANGDASFSGCLFTGYRGIKIHEFDSSEDVKTVTIKDCTFDNLSEKPGIAIGTVNKQTSISIKGNTFDKCAEWDTIGSLVGVNGIYECDTPRFEFTLEEKGNTVISR